MQINRKVEIPTGGFGAWPPLAALKDNASLFENFTQSNRLEGFAGDGDYVNLPIASTETVEIYNAAGTNIKNVSHANVQSAHASIAPSYWLGFAMKDDLIYMVSIDIGTAQHWVTTVNSAGAVVAKGIGTPTTPQSFSTGQKWISNPASAGSSSIQFDPITGDINCYINSSNGVQFYSLDPSDGSVVQDTIYGVSGIGDASWQFIPWKMANGKYTWHNSSSAITLWDDKLSKMVITNTADISGAIGQPAGNAYRMVQWKDRIYSVYFGSEVLGGNVKRWLATEYEAWVDAVQESRGA